MVNELKNLDTNFKIVSMETARRFAEVIVDTNFCPESLVKNCNKRENAIINVAIAILSGMELGMSPLNSLRSFCIINGTPTLWGNAKNALAIQSGNLLKIEAEYFGVEHTMDWGCKVTVFRKNPEMSFTADFTMKDAEKAGLLSKNNWHYPKKMLYNRAKQTAFNEIFADCYFNIYSTEEIEELPMREVVENTPDNIREKSEENLIKRYAEKVKEEETQPTKQQTALAEIGFAKPEVVNNVNKYREALGQEPIEEEKDPNLEAINDIFDK
jgi:hypothetical protein